MVFYFSIFAHYIRLRQQFKVQQFARTMKKIKKCIEKGRMSLLDKLWFKYMNLNMQMSNLCEEITAHNKFWCKYLTLLYLLYIIASCYFIYAFFFDKNGNFWVKLYLAYFATLFLFILVFATWQCSTIVYNNVRIHRTSQKLAMRFIFANQLNIHHMFTIDALASNYQNVKDISFKLLNNYRIDSEMFQFLLSYSTMLFLKVFGKEWVLSSTQVFLQNKNLKVIKTF